MSVHVNLKVCVFVNYTFKSVLKMIINLLLSLLSYHVKWENETMILRKNLKEALELLYFTRSQGYQGLVNLTAEQIHWNG